MTTDSARPATDLGPDLDEFLDGPEPDWDDPDLDTVIDRKEADRLVRWYTRVQTAAAADNDHAQAQIAQIQGWNTARQHTHAGRLGYLERKLRNYYDAARREIAATGATAPLSFETPAGRIGSRALPASAEVQDNDGFTAWAIAYDRDHPAPNGVSSLVRITPEKYDPALVEIKRRAVPAADVAKWKRKHVGEPEFLIDALGRIVVAETSEIVPGIRIVRGEAKFYVTPATGETAE